MSFMIFKLAKPPEKFSEENERKYIVHSQDGDLECKISYWMSFDARIKDFLSSCKSEPIEIEFPACPVRCVRLVDHLLCHGQVDVPTDCVSKVVLLILSLNGVLQQSLVSSNGEVIVSRYLVDQLPQDISEVRGKSISDIPCKSQDNIKWPPTIKAPVVKKNSEVRVKSVSDIPCKKLEGDNIKCPPVIEALVVEKNSEVTRKSICDIPCKKLEDDNIKCPPVIEALVMEKNNEVRGESICDIPCKKLEDDNIKCPPVIEALVVEKNNEVRGESICDIPCKKSQDDSIKWPPAIEAPVVEENSEVRVKSVSDIPCKESEDDNIKCPPTTEAPVVEKNSEEVPSKICDCNSPSQNDYSFDLRAKPLPPDLADLKGVEPVEIPGEDPLLTGRITKIEEDLPDWDASIEIHPKASLEREERLILLKAIKLGKLPHLTVHNLSLILWKIPCFSIQASTYHTRCSNFICIFCGSKVLNFRKELLFHVQKFHTGFVTTCDACSLAFPCEKSAAAHMFQYHGKKKPCNLVCQKERFFYLAEAYEAARMIQDLKPINKFIQLDKIKEKKEKKKSRGELLAESLLAGMNRR